MTWLAVIAAINMTIELFYYASIIAEMYFDAPSRVDCVTGGIGYATGLALCLLGTLTFGIAPALLLLLSHAADVLHLNQTFCAGTALPLSASYDLGPKPRSIYASCSSP